MLSQSWVSPGDYDGDGRCDFARIGPAPGGGIDVWVALSKRGTFGKPRIWGSWNEPVFDKIRTLNRVG